MAKRSIKIQGKLVDANKQALSNLRVEAWDKDKLVDDFVGEAVSDDNGDFKITFTQNRYKELFLDNNPDIYFKIYHGDNLIHSTENSELWNIKMEQLNLEIVIERWKENNPPDDTDKRFKVKGHVRKYDGSAVTGATVRAYDKDLRTEVLLGQSLITEAGYEINYNPQKLGKTNKGNADIQIRVYEILGNKDEKLLATSDIFFNVAPMQEINLTLATDEKSKSQWEQLNEELLPLLKHQKQLLVEATYYTDLSPAELLPSDIQFLAKDTGRSDEQIRQWALAYKNEIKTDSIPAEAFYAWYQQGLPEEPLLLWPLGAEKLIESLQKAIAKKTIAQKDEAWFNALREKINSLFIGSKLEPAAAGDTASLGDILLVAGNDWIKQEQLHQLAFIADTLDPDADDFSSTVKEIDLTADQEIKLRHTLRLAKITMRHPALMKELQPWLDNGHEDTLQGLAGIQTDQWIDLAYTYGSSPGTYMEPEAYALSMKKDVEVRYPTAYLANGIQAGTILSYHTSAKRIGQVLEENPGFNIVEGDVDEFSKKAKLTEKESGALQHIQNLKKLGADYDTADTFIKYGFTSVARIVEYTPFQIKTVVGGELTLEEITATHALANQAQILSIGLLSYLQPIFYGTGSAVTQTKKESDSPTLRKLFGSLEQCACTPCRSVLSPAAYYADLLKFIDVSGTAGIELQKKRPDLFDLELSCENAEIELPHIDLSLEILENALVLPKTISLPPSINPELQLDENQIGEEIKSALQQTAEDKIGSLWAEKATDSIRPITYQPGKSYWVVKDPFRRWSISLQKQVLGTATVIANGTAVNFDAQTIIALVDWLNSDGMSPISFNLKESINQLLLNSLVSPDFPTSIHSSQVTILEPSRRWRVRLTTKTKFSIITDDSGASVISKTAEDGSQEKHYTYSSRTTEAIISSLNQGETNSILLVPKGAAKPSVAQEADGVWVVSPQFDIELFHYEAQLTIEGLSYQSTARDQDLLVKPQNKNPLAYQVLSSSSSNFPWSLPYDQTLTEVRLLLKKAGLPLSMLRQLSLPVGEVNNDFRSAIEQLNVTPVEADIITTPLSTGALWKAWGLTLDNGVYVVYDHYTDQEIRSANPIELLRQTSVLIRQAQIEFSQLEELLTINEYINPGNAVKILYDQACNITKTVLSENADGSFFDRLHRFIRLWKKTDWRTTDLDKFLSFFSSGLNDRAVLAGLANFAVLLQQMEIPFEYLYHYFKIFDDTKISMIGGNPTARKPLYDEVFQNKKIQNPLNPDFEFEKFNGVHSKPLEELLPYITACLGAKSEHLKMLLQSALPDFPSASSSLTLSLLHNLWRHVELISHLNLSTEDYIHAHKMISPTSSVFSSRLTLLNFIREVAYLKSNKIDILSLRTLLTSDNISSIVDADRAFEILVNLQQKLRDIPMPDAQSLESEIQSAVNRRSDVLVQTLSKETELDVAVVTELLFHKLSIGSTNTIKAQKYFITNFLEDSNQITRQGLEATQGYKVFVKLTKIHLLNSHWKASASQLKWLRESDQTPGYLGIILNALPTSGQETIAYLDWKKTTLLYSLLQENTNANDLFKNYLAALGTGTTRPQLNSARNVIADYFGVPLSEVNAGAVNQLMDNAGDISAQTPPQLQYTTAQFDPLKFAGLLSYMEVLKKWGLKGHDVEMLLATPTTSNAVVLARGILKQIFQDGFPDALQQINNRLRIEQRDRLVAYLCWRDNLADANRLYERYLIDVQMQPCMRTTRLLQSTAAAQLFVHRSLMNLERLVSPEWFDKKRWEWTQNYRVWEANRKVFLYPENWLYPELRDDKTEPFKELESKLQTGETIVSDVDNIVDDYLKRLAQHSNIMVKGLFEFTHDQRNNLLVIGRIQNEPLKYFWRICSGWRESSFTWTSWNEIKFDISSVYIIPFVIEGEPYVAWPIIKEIEDKDATNQKDKTKWHLSLKWASLKDSKTIVSKSKDLIAPKVNGKQLETSFAFKVKLINDTNSNVILPTKTIPVVEIDCFCAIPPKVNSLGTKLTLQPTLFNTSSQLLPTGYDAQAWVNVKIGSFTNFREGGKPNINQAVQLEALTWTNEILSPNNPFNVSPRSIVQCTDSNGFSVIRMRLDDLVDQRYTSYMFSNGLSWKLRASCEGTSFEFAVTSNWITNANADLNAGQRPASFILHYETAFVVDNTTVETPIVPVGNDQRLVMARFGSFSISKHQDGTMIQFPVNDQSVRLLSPSSGYKEEGGNKDNTGARFGISTSKIPNGIVAQILEGNFSTDKFLAIAESDFSQNDIQGGRMVGDEQSWHYTDSLSNFYIGADKTSTTNYKKTIVLSETPLALESVSQLKMGTQLELQNYSDLDTSRTPQIGRLFSKYGFSNLSNKSMTERRVNFDNKSPEAVYNWELFYHVFMQIATTFSNQHRFAEARKWFHFIFDPTTNDATPGIERFWKFLPFRENTQSDSITKLLDTLANPNAPATEKEAIQNQVGAWLDAPFNPFAVARMRPSAFQWRTVTSYIKNLVEWGDQLFRRDTRESINEATMLYVTAYSILGQRPAQLRKRDASVFNMSYREIGQLDAFSNRWVTMLDTPFGKALLALLTKLNTIGINPHGSDEAIKQLSSVGSVYFCVPPNEKTTALWDAVEDRLFKIRNCRNIDGVVRTLPLLDPPIDPELLIRAKAKGLSVQDALDGLYAPPPLYRFNIRMQKATEICNEVKSLGASLLSAIEKKESEHLSLMRSGQEMDMQKLITIVRQEQINEAMASIDTLKKSRENIIDRIVHLQRQMGIDQVNYDTEGIPVLDQTYLVQSLKKSDPLASDFAGLGLIKSEEDQILWMQTNNVLNLIAGGFHAGGGVSHIVAAGFGGEPTGIGYRVSTGIGHASSAFGTLFNTLAAHYGMLEKRSGQMAGWQRRRDEWLHLAKTAVTEIHQLDKQIIAAEIRVSITQKELENHKKQMEHTRELDEYIRNQKFSNEALYTWMQTRLSDVYFAAYQLALDQAKVAQRAYEFELGVEKTSFIKPAYWDSLQKGLLAGESLSHDLHRMEISYLEKNQREYEITKHISLRQLDPLAIVQLRQDGKCEFALPEVLFDMDYSSQYFRRIKSVSLSIPCITGPYTSVSSKLTLKNSRYRKDTAISGNNYPEISNDVRFSTDNRSQSISASGAQNDSGVFELNFRDERYLPFEGRGVISSWEIELPQTIHQFDYNTISDAVIHVKYTSRESTDSNFKLEVARTLTQLLNRITQQFSNTGLHVSINLKHDMPNEWNLLKQNGTTKIEIDKSRLPYFAQSATISKVMLISKSATPPIKRKATSSATAVALEPLALLGRTGLYSIDLSGVSFETPLILSGNETAQNKLDELVLIVKFNVV